MKSAPAWRHHTGWGYDEVRDRLESRYHARRVSVGIRTRLVFKSCMAEGALWVKSRVKVWVSGVAAARVKSEVLTGGSVRTMLRPGRRSRLQ